MQFAGLRAQLRCFRTFLLTGRTEKRLGPNCHINTNYHGTLKVKMPSCAYGEQPTLRALAM